MENWNISHSVYIYFVGWIFIVMPCNKIVYYKHKQQFIQQIKMNVNYEWFSFENSKFVGQWQCCGSFTNLQFCLYGSFNTILFQLMAERHHCLAISHWKLINSNLKSEFLYIVVVLPYVQQLKVLIACPKCEYSLYDIIRYIFTCILVSSGHIELVIDFKCK